MDSEYFLFGCSVNLIARQKMYFIWISTWKYLDKYIIKKLLVLSR